MQGAILLSIAAASSAMVEVCEHWWHYFDARDVQLAFVIVNPFAIGCFISIHVTLLTELVGLERTSRAFAMVNFYQGFMVSSLPLMVGLMFDTTQSNVLAMRVCSCIYVLAAACMWTVVAMHTSRRRREEVSIVVRCDHRPFLQQIYPTDAEQKPSTAAPVLERFPSRSNGDSFVATIRKRSASFSQLLFRHRQKAINCSQVAAVE